MTRLAVLCAALAITGCGKDKGKDSDKGGGAAAGGASTGTPDPAAANALVPADLKDKLVFETRKIVLERGKNPTTYTVAAPKTWTQQGKMFATLKADDKGGFFSEFKIASDCDGACKPKEWAPIAEKNFFAERAKGKVAKDVKGTNNRLMIADVEKNGVKTTDVVFAWWSEGASSYHACVATLDEAVKAAAPAFEKACQAVSVEGDD